MQSPVPDFQKLRVQGRPPSLPEGERIYAVGDVHGRVDLLDDLLARIADDIRRRPTPRALYVFLGDYIDRGPSSRETIDRLIELNQHRECVFLKGNHEQIALKCLRDQSLFDQWLRLGGLQTLASYGLPIDPSSNGKPIAELQATFHDALPRSHFRFFRDLKGWFARGDYFFVHAGVRPSVALSEQKESDLLWIRGDFLSSEMDFGKIIVHGHTPSNAIEVATNRINIDTGAYATDRLSCLVLEQSALSVIDTLSLR